MITLRQYQTELIDATRKAFRNGYKRPLVVLPCGAGKTVCFADMAERHVRKPHHYVWFLVHRRELVAQTLETFESMGIKHDHVLVDMVQTVSLHIDRYNKPTLIIFDEAHHATAKTWTNIINAYQDVPVVGLTATPARRDGRALGDIFDELVIGAEAEWLQDNGYLAPYDYYAPRTVDLKTVTLRGGEYDSEDVTNVLIESRIYGDVMKYIDTNAYHQPCILTVTRLKQNEIVSCQISVMVIFVCWST